MRRFLKSASKACRWLRSAVWVRMPVRAAENRFGSERIVVGVTTYPRRERSAHLTIRSLLKQSRPADSIVLVLSREEYPDGQSDLPRKTRDLCAKHSGRIRVLLTNGNMRSYKKLIPLLSEYGDCTIVTADDDVVYGRRWLEELEQAHISYPGVIIGSRGTEVLVAHGRMEAYLSWPTAEAGRISKRVFLTGRGGILYPPGALDDLASDWALADQLCPTADDIWFKAMALRAGTPSMRIHLGSEYASSRLRQRDGLYRVNNEMGANDQALSAVESRFGPWGSLD